jgi:HEPN domain-containing protein
MAKSRNDFQRLAELRLIEARFLLDAGFSDGAYYLAGYAVECALKACIAKGTHQYDFPDKKLVEKSYTHDVEKLLDAAGMIPSRVFSPGTGD